MALEGVAGGSVDSSVVWKEKLISIMCEDTCDDHQCLGASSMQRFNQEGLSVGVEVNPLLS